MSRQQPRATGSRAPVRAAALCLLVLSLGAGALPAAAESPARTAAEDEALPELAPQFATRPAGRSGRAIGLLLGAGGLRPLGAGTAVSLRCVKGCRGSKRARIGEKPSQLQLELRSPWRLAHGAVVELRATRSGLLGRWHRYRIVKHRHGLLAMKQDGGCLAGQLKRACPLPRAADPAPVAAKQAPDAQAAPATAPAPAIRMLSPDDHSTVKGTVRLMADVSNASGVEWRAYYASDVEDATTLGWTVLGRDTDAGDGLSLDWDTKTVRNQGDGSQGTVNIVAIALNATGAPTDARDYRRVNVVNYDLTADGYVGCADVQLVMSQYGGSGSADVNGDGKVNIQDVGVLLGNLYRPPGEQSGACP